MEILIKEEVGVNVLFTEDEDAVGLMEEEDITEEEDSMEEEPILKEMHPRKHVLDVIRLVIL